MTREESGPDSESEGEALEAPRATCGRPRKATYVTPTRRRGVPIHLSGNRHSTLASLPSPEPMTVDEDSSEDEGCIIPSNLVDNPPSSTEKVEADRQSSMPELITDMISDVQSLPDQTIYEVDNIQEHEQ